MDIYGISIFATKCPITINVYDKYGKCVERFKVKTFEEWFYYERDRLRDEYNGQLLVTSLNIFSERIVISLTQFEN